MRSLILLAALSLTCLLAGCASQAEKPDANYAAYLELIKTQQQESQEQRNAFAIMATKCTTDSCVAQVAAIAALAGASGHGAAPPQQYVPRESTAAKFGLALVSQIAPLAGAAVSWHAADTSKDVSLAQFGFLGGAMHDLTGSATTLGTATVDAAAGMTPSVNIGGDYTGGDKIGGDAIGHDRIDNSGVYNTGTIDRYQSPSDDHSATNGGCTGSTTCQAPPPPVTPPPGP